MKAKSIFVGHAPKWLGWLFRLFGRRINSGYGMSVDTTCWIDCISCGQYIDTMVSESFIAVCPNCGRGYLANYQIISLPRVDWLTRNAPNLEGE